MRCTAHALVLTHLVRVLHFDILQCYGDKFALRRWALKYAILLDRANNSLDSFHNVLLEVIATRANSFEVSKSRVLVDL